MLNLLVFLLPLGLDSLSASLSVGMKRRGTNSVSRSDLLSFWFRSVLLFSATEMVMPLVGVAIGYELSWVLSKTMQVIGALLLMGLGLWELQGEFREAREKHRRQTGSATTDPAARLSGTQRSSPVQVPQWARSLLLALSISIDELVVGFSLGTISPLTGHKGSVSLWVLCLLIGLQGCLMTVTGLALGHWLGSSLKIVRQCNEWITGLLLVGLGIWLLFFTG